MPFDILSVKFLLACAGSVLAGLLLRALLPLALRRWPALGAQRAVWLAAQAVVLAVFVLTLAPRSAQLSIFPQAALLPALQLPVPMAGASPAPQTQLAASSAQAARDIADPAPATPARQTGAPQTQPPGGASATGPAVQHGAVHSLLLCLDSLPLLWLCLYGAGLSYALWRQLRARRLWKALLSGATHLDRGALHDHGGFTLLQQQEIAQHGIAVMETPAAISPMLAGARHALMLLPEHLRSFPAAQQQMIIEHELTHWRRHDPALMSLAVLLRTVFWFNPALPWLSGKLACAQELSCDSTVLAGRPVQLRQQYAAALLAQFKAQTQLMNCTGSAFGGKDSASVAERIRQLRGAVSHQPGVAAKCLLGLMLAAPMAAALVLQPALALPPEQATAARKPEAVLPAPPVPPTPTLPATPRMPPVPAVPSATGLAPVPAAPAAPAEPAMPAAPALPGAPAAPPVPAAPAAPAAARNWQYPLEQVRVSSFFGVSRSVLATPHKGIDLAAGKGTPVLAAAPGRVVAAGKLAINDGRYGNTVIIEHGGQRSLYAHLDSISVQVGNQVAAGQRIGRVGETGFATGPHLHFEVLQGEQRLDPQTMLANLDEHASKHALRQRREQLGH